MHKRFRDLFSPKALPAWVLLVWNVVGAFSRIEYIGKKMSVLSDFAQTPLGNIVLLLSSVAWLTLVVCWPGLKSWCLGQAATAIVEVDLVTSKDQESPGLSNLDYARLADTKEQLLCLSHFERFALWQLLLKDGMIGEYFADLVMIQYGIPVGSVAAKRDLANTFAVIQAKSALLAYDQDSERWTIRPEVKDFVHYVIVKRLSPVFGL
jgi:hypothetical protein